MPTVPDSFWVAGDPPREAPVTSVTPTRIYLTVDGDGQARTVELDREEWVAHGRIVPVLAHDADYTSVFATRQEAQAQLAAADRDALLAAETHVQHLKREIARLEEELTQAKKARKRARRALKGRSSD